MADRNKYGSDTAFGGEGVTSSEVVSAVGANCGDLHLSSGGSRTMLEGTAAAVRPSLLARVQASTPVVAAFQRACGVPPPAKSKVEDGGAVDSGRSRGILLLHWLFTLGASFGNELFYILALPAVFWQLDDTVGRETILLWCGVYYVGQALKDVLRLPRPPDGVGGVRRLEAHYEAEYGAPSTHAMCAFSLPWFVVWLCTGRWEIPVQSWAPWIGAAAWCITMTLSRLYMGVHSTVDIIMGAALGLAHLAVSLAFGRYIDLLQLQMPWTPFVVPLFTIALSAMYPRPSKWVNSPGDTILILGVATGVCLGQWVTYHADVVRSGALPPTGPICAACALDPATMLPRAAVGYAVLFATRAACKAVCIALLTAALPPSKEPPARRYAVELPTKWVTYSAVGFNAVYTVPRLLDWMGWTRALPA